VARNGMSIRWKSFGTRVFALGIREGYERVLAYAPHDMLKRCVREPVLLLSSWQRSRSNQSTISQLESGLGPGSRRSTQSSVSSMGCDCELILEAESGSIVDRR